MRDQAATVGEIERDREIAARVTQGEWRSRRGQLHIGTPHRDWRTPPTGAYAVDLLGSNASDDVEHIVRLHNRQPLYDALVDAARFAIDAVGWRGAAPASWSRMTEALAALDATEKAGSADVALTNTKHHGPGSEK